MSKRSEAAPRHVDWGEVRQRLDVVARTLAGDTKAPLEEMREILKARARTLAVPLDREREATEDVVLFELSSETYALDARYVWEVFRLTALSALPGAQPPVLGLAAWRGNLLTILDLRQVLGVPVRDLTDLSSVIVLGEERPAFGILADAVGRIAAVRREDVREPPEGVAARRKYVKGITGDAIIVLAGEILLAEHTPATRRDARPAEGA